MAKKSGKAPASRRRRPAEINRTDGPRFPAPRPSSPAPPSANRPLIPPSWRGTGRNAPAPHTAAAVNLPERTSQTLPGEGRVAPGDSSAQRRMRATVNREAASSRMRGTSDDAQPAPQEYLNHDAPSGAVAPMHDAPNAENRGRRHDDVDETAQAPAAADVDGYDITRELLGGELLQPAPAKGLTKTGGITYRLDGSVDLECIDRLFFWSREDAAGVKKFLGWQPKTSLDLHTWFQRMGQIIGAGKGGLYIIVKDGPKTDAEHIGFIMLLPIVRTPGAAPVGTVHIFVAPAYRGDFVNIVSGAVNDADRLAPGVTLFISTASVEMTKLFESLGFDSGFHLTRQSTVKE